MKDLELAAQAVHMRELVGSPHWGVYRNLIEKGVSARIEQLIALQGAEGFEYLQGQIKAMRDMLSLPEHIIKRSKNA